MIETFFSLGQLDTANALFLSAVIGIFFGIALEQAGFGSSRRLAAVFYFKDMAVIKVMFTAMITAICCLQLSFGLGWISEQTVYLNPTIYGAQVFGGFLFGIGFVMGGWCPGTAAVGAASGKWDALVFLVGAVMGSAFFNESYGLVQGLYQAKEIHVAFLYDSMGMSREWFILLFVAIGMLVFWGVEFIEKKTTGHSAYFNSRFLKQFSVAGMIAGFFVFLVAGTYPASQNTEPAAALETEVKTSGREQNILTGVEDAQDHIEPEELADRISSGFRDIVLVDVRPQSEFSNFHIKTARNILLTELIEKLEPYKNRGMIVLYSNGMTHPAQARDALSRLGFQNVYILTDGLEGFMQRCLKPFSLRSEPVPDSLAQRINQWRNFFLDISEPGQTLLPAAVATSAGSMQGRSVFPGIVDAAWLSDRLLGQRIRIIDLRNQPEYNTAHIPGSYALNVESLRGNRYGVPSCLLPADLLAGQLSLMGITPETHLVIIHGEKVQDATLAGMAFERLGHLEYSILKGGFAGWKNVEMKTDTRLPDTTPSAYPLENKDRFTVDHNLVLSHVNKPGTAVILDVRPKAYYTGEKSDEARAGHIPGAINRPFDMDTIKTGDMLEFKTVSELETAYSALIASKQDLVIVHCRTGHQASQTFFVLKHLLGYEQVLWYDAGWTQWAAMPELPVKTGEMP